MPQGPGLASRSGLIHRPIAGWGALGTRGGHTRQPSLLVPSGLTVAVTHLRDVSGHVSLHQSHTNVAHLNWTLRSPSPGCGAAGRGSHTAAAEDHRSAAERCRPSCPRLGPALAASAACTGWTMAGATAPQGAKGGEEVGVRACLEDLGNCFHFRGKGGQLPDHWSLLTFTGMVMNQFR